MKQKLTNKKIIHKIALIGLLTALATVLSYIKIPILSSVTITLVLPVVVIGAALCGPLVGAWLTVIPNITALPEAALFMSYNAFGTVLTLFAKGLLAGFAAGAVYKLLSKKHPLGAVTCSAIVAPVVNTGVFLLGCYVFVWDALVDMAIEANVGMGMLIFGLAGMNFIVELILNIVLCPAIFRIIQIATKKNLA